MFLAVGLGVCVQYFQCWGTKEGLGGTLGVSQALSMSPHLLRQLLDLEHQGLRFPCPFLSFQQGLVQLQLLFQQLFRLGQLSCAGTLREGVGGGSISQGRICGPWSQEFCHSCF